MGAYAGAARRRVHLATVRFRPPSGHRPGRRQARVEFSVLTHLTTDSYYVELGSLNESYDSLPYSKT